ncbi:MAG: hypothetical protein K2X32_14685, partial [Phycisphaerales bacterium]|nr:hypothetical protein [Phycisphaerales bacterium]
MGAIVPKRIQVKPTLRGLVVTNHKKNPPERVGEVLPYAEVKALQRGSWVAVADGVSRLGNPHIIYEFPLRAEAVAMRARERAIWQAFLRG